MLVFGAGFMGTYLTQWMADHDLAASLVSVDIRDARAVGRQVMAANPDIVVNCAGATDIDWCEVHRDEATSINTVGADHVAAAAAVMGARLVHISSGCVQQSSDRDDLRAEEDAARPRCHYAWTKLWAEDRIRARVERQSLEALVLRPRLIVSAVVSRRNTLVKMLTYRGFVDTPNSCTVLEDLATALGELLEQRATGVLNVVNPGVTSPYRIARLLGHIVDERMTPREIAKWELDRTTLATRVDTVLSGRKLRDRGITLPSIEQRLVDLMSGLRDDVRTCEGLKALARTCADTRAKLSLRAGGL